MPRFIVGIVEKIEFKSNPDIHTVSYDKTGRAIASRNQWTTDIKAQTGEWSEVHRKLSIAVHKHLKTFYKVDANDFSFTVRFADLDEDGAFYPYFTGCGETIHFNA